MTPQVLSPSDHRYPGSLKRVFGGLLPPDIWYVGNLDLFNTRGVGFCGSRNATEKGLKVAADCARQLSEHGINVVSGYASGVDMASHETALAQSGSTIIVLAEGIDHFRIKRTIKPMWDWERVLVISYFARNAIWRGDRAMDRNKVIVGLSDAVVVVEAREQGGTLNAGFAALKMGRPLFVAVYDEMNGAREGNLRLIAAGGIPLTRRRNSDEAQMSRVIELIEHAEHAPQSVGSSH
jgi:DNA protecting protein DprA